MPGPRGGRANHADNWMRKTRRLAKSYLKNQADLTVGFREQEDMYDEAEKVGRSGTPVSYEGVKAIVEIPRNTLELYFDRGGSITKMVWTPQNAPVTTDKPVRILVRQGHASRMFKSILHKVTKRSGSAENFEDLLGFEYEGIGGGQDCQGQRDEGSRCQKQE